MIINIRGTSGTGKSTLVRNIIALYGAQTKYHLSGRKQPIGYTYKHPNGGRDLAVVGHYETACGGCDTIASLDQIFSLVRQSHDAGMDVLFEGLLISADVNRTAQLHHDGMPLLVVALDLPLEECLASVNARRRAKRPDAPDVNPKNTESKHKGVKKSMERLQSQQVRAVWANRDEGLGIIRRELKL